MSRALDAVDAETLARVWLPWAIRWMRRRVASSWDAEQMAVDGLNAALRRHDPERGQFSATQWADLRGALADERRRQGRLKRPKLQPWPAALDVGDPGSGDDIAAIDARDHAELWLGRIGEPEASWLRRLAAGESIQEVAASAGYSREHVGRRLQRARVAVGLAVQSRNDRPRGSDRG